MTILRQNLIDALRLAVDSQEAAEATQGYQVDSAFLAGLRSTLAGLRAGERLEVK